MMMLNTVMILLINDNYKYDVGGKIVRYFIFQFDNLLSVDWDPLTFRFHLLEYLALEHM